MSIEQIKARCVIDECGCWIPSIGLRAGGASQMRINGKQQTTRRAALELIGKPAPSPKHYALPRLTCSHGCANPAHLFWGTGKDKNEQARKNGMFGEAHKAANAIGRRKVAKNTMEDANRVRELLAQGMPKIHIAAETGVSRTMVWRIATGQNWRESVSAASVFTWRP